MMNFYDQYPVLQSTSLSLPKVLGEQPLIHPSARISKTYLGGWTDIGPNCHLLESSIGDYSYLAGDAQVIYSKIGKFCSIASHACINPGNHPMGRVSQHHFTYRRRQYGFGAQDDLDFFDWRKSDLVTIENDVWIGHGATITAGTSVGTGAVIGAGAVVTHDVYPYEIVGGVPAKRIRWRFSDEVIKKLLAIAWWDWDHPIIEERFKDFLDLDIFLEKYA